MSYPLGLSNARVAIFAFSMLLVASIGCSGRPKNVARSVTGKVTLGGQPLAGAVITFTPTDGGSPSFGITDAGGSYTLVWAQIRGRKIEGAQIGAQTVKISTFVEGDPDAKPPIPEVPERVPLKYRQEGGYLTATVTKGANAINFDLEPGPVDAPAPKGKPGTKGRKVGCG